MRVFFPHNENKLSPSENRNTWQFRNSTDLSAYSATNQTIKKNFDEPYARVKTTLHSAGN